MRYRRLSYRYAVVVGAGPTWPDLEFWTSDRPRLLGRAHWQPDMDVYETARTVEVIVDLAGLAEEDFEVQVFEDALVVEGRRDVPSLEAGAVYHVAGIRHGPFQLGLTLPALVDVERGEARYDRGFLRVTLPKREERR
jgi:HSP20 family molecular chaperone IbpA